MSIKLIENQLIAVHLIASGVKASNISKQIGIREETLSRWRQEDIFKEALEDTTEIILKEIVFFLGYKRVLLVQTESYIC